jgi:hypothetical protein
MALILNGTNGISDVDGTAATPAIRGTDTDTGIFFPAADTIGFSKGGAQVGEFDSSGNFKFNSGYGSVATAYGCRAWVNFNGTNTIAIRASGNVSSITDNGTGDFTINFSTAFPDANYSVSGVTSGYFSQGQPQGSFIIINTNTEPTTNAVRIFSRESFSQVDSTYTLLSIFR